MAPIRSAEIQPLQTKEDQIKYCILKREIRFIEFVSNTQDQKVNSKR